MIVVGHKREEAKRARTRLDAALDALNADPEQEDSDVLSRIWEALSGRVADTDGDIRKLNAVLRELFASFELHRDEEGMRIVPVLSETAIARILQDPARWPHGAHIHMTGNLLAPPGFDLKEEIHPCNPPALTDAQKPATTSQKASVRPSKATMSSSPQRVR
jgi:hypothetical protein